VPGTCEPEFCLGPLGPSSQSEDILIVTEISRPGFEGFFEGVSKIARLGNTIP
jgi:hypothetical protein